MRIRIGIILAAVAAAVVPFPRTIVERLYSGALYLHLQRTITPVSNVFPFALFDWALMLAAIALILVAIARIRRRRWAGLVLDLAVFAATIYLVFLALWGLNYRRVPLIEKLQFDAQAESPSHASGLEAAAVDQLNSLHDAAHSLGWRPLGSIDPDLAQAFDRTQRELGAADPAIPARPKTTLLGPLFRVSAVEGMTDPFFLETLIQSEVLPFERPMDVAHEWGHLAGYADESEASFTGLLTCLRGSVADQYSGWLFLFDELYSAVTPLDRREVVGRLAPGPIADLRDIQRRRIAQVNRTVARTSGRIYDGYLKANRIPSGIANYDEVVRLMLGARFGPDWTPLLKSSAAVGAPARQ